MSGSSRKNATQLQQLPSTDPKLLKQIRKAEKAEREFRKKFKVRTLKNESWDDWYPRPMIYILGKKPR